MQFRPISVAGVPLAGGRLPAVCAPLVARTHEALLAEAQAVAARGPDLLEWRVDFFEAIADTGAVLQAAQAVRGAAAGIPLLFTRRAQREGGEPIPLAEPAVVALYRAVCAARAADLVDFEMGNAGEHVREVRDCSRAHGIGLVLSFHDFAGTPPLDAMRSRFAEAQRLGADVAKVAVMPRTPEDVLRLLDATLQAARAQSIPVVSMAMGGLGAVSRLCGGAFGSALTFAVGRKASAPGQIPIADVQAALAVLRNASAG